MWWSSVKEVGDKWQIIYSYLEWCYSSYVTSRLTTPWCRVNKLYPHLIIIIIILISSHKFLVRNYKLVGWRWSYKCHRHLDINIPGHNSRHTQKVYRCWLLTGHWGMRSLPALLQLTRQRNNEQKIPPLLIWRKAILEMLSYLPTGRHLRNMRNIFSFV